MKHSIISKFIGPLLLMACCFASSSAFAHTPHVREASGVIQSIDPQKQILTLTNVQERGPQKLIWNSDTEFLRDSKLVPAKELKEGTKITVYYHSPFFSQPYATKVVWSSSP